jgi:hypothetical protein
MYSTTQIKDAGGARVLVLATFDNDNIDKSDYDAAVVHVEDTKTIDRWISLMDLARYIQRGDPFFSGLEYWDGGAAYYPVDWDATHDAKTEPEDSTGEPPVIPIMSQDDSRTEGDRLLVTPDTIQWEASIKHIDDSRLYTEVVTRRYLEQLRARIEAEGGDQ